MSSHKSTARPFGSAFSSPAKKHLGQNFLHDRSVIDKIVQAVNPKPGDRLVEIGPGQGALTFPLLDRHGQLTVIEFDRDLVGPLTEMARQHGRLDVIHRDVLQVDFTALAASGATSGNPDAPATSMDARIRLVGNLPYNLSSPILFHALDHAAAITDMVFMLQKEVVDRMAAGPGSKVYGRLSVMLQAYCTVHPLFVVPPGAFHPVPKVDSAVVRLVPRPATEIGVVDRTLFANVVRDAFGQRRKTLRNALSRICDTAAMESAGISPQARAEQIPVADFVRLANSLVEAPV
ncbi:16S rRNA (adenine(1518)-N(6)/adenine(1519)-N(6))-dimethyltransferase RsmA [Lysobacter sp. A03]|uniref:16S rRNA (adenine(1518)-N(6)/adenine(1519)-N(6))- dimethyltransferase RsmA n=1 Tax=Lysobacter sp. A03 TaxID=1199154 RepID=UPI0005B70DD6|nr:16S rRNA (adenine(1518)-N(6)/adenine(1519)-N(6))-dimethyltransferase RsmA [Lysobacter sp. A03]KIQ97930.1 SSU rRNA (adenine(1518)-N(6)/adenine(1519)-N(6))- dimethyltransferase [Lysobacter sp. A03]